MTSANGGFRPDVFPLCLGGNVFGWTMDERESFAVLDAYASAGGNFVDTADVYAVWVDGNVGGESETIIGNWMAARGNRSEMVVATKVGQMNGVTADAVRDAADASLRRLRTDYIDLYYTHVDDPNVPLEETLGALDELVRAGKARQIGASGYGAERLREALAISNREHKARYVALQPQYNLVERDAYEGDLMDVCRQEGIACFPFFGLARGFLSGKYRPGQEPETKRGAFGWTGELDARALAVLDALDEVAAGRAKPVAAIALAWLAAQPTVRAPIASARTVDQVQEIVQMADVQLDQAELHRLAEAAA